MKKIRFEADLYLVEDLSPYGKNGVAGDVAIALHYGDRHQSFYFGEIKVLSTTEVEDDE